MVHADDAMFFQEVQTVVTALQAAADAEKSADERRQASRTSYVTMQFIAPYDGVNLPHQTDLQLVPCVDLSPSGISFVCREPPTFETLIVLLGKVPMKGFIAKVRNVVELAGSSGLYKVGCQLQDRV